MLVAGIHHWSSLLFFPELQFTCKYLFLGQMTSFRQFQVISGDPK